MPEKERLPLIAVLRFAMTIIGKSAVSNGRDEEERKPKFCRGYQEIGVYDKG